MIEETTYISEGLERPEVEKILKEVSSRAHDLIKRGHRDVKVHWFVESQKAVLSYGNKG